MKIKAELLSLLKSNLKEDRNARTFAPARDGFQVFLRMHRVGEQSPGEVPQFSQLQSRPPVPKPAVSTLTRHSSVQGETQDKLKSSSTVADLHGSVPKQKQSARKKSGDLAETIATNATHALPVNVAGGTVTVSDAASMLPSVKSINKLEVSSLGAAHPAILNTNSPSLGSSDIGAAKAPLSTKAETGAESKQSGISNTIVSKPEPLARSPRSHAEPPAKAMSVDSQRPSEARATEKTVYNGGQSVPTAQTSSLRRQSDSHAATVPERVVEAKTLDSGLHRPPVVRVAREIGISSNLNNTHLPLETTRTEAKVPPRSVESVVRASRNDLAFGLELEPGSRRNLQGSLNKEGRERQDTTRDTQQILPTKQSPESLVPRPAGQGANLYQHALKTETKQIAKEGILSREVHFESLGAAVVADSSISETMSYRKSLATPRGFTDSASTGSLTKEAPTQEGARKHDSGYVSALSKSIDEVAKDTSAESAQMHPYQPKPMALNRSQNPVIAPRQQVLPDIASLFRNDVRSDHKATDPGLFGQNSTGWQNRSKTSASADSNPIVYSLDNLDPYAKGSSSAKSHNNSSGVENEPSHADQFKAASSGPSFSPNGLTGVTAKAAAWGRLANEALQAALQQALEQSRRRVAEPDELRLVVPFGEFGTLDIDVIRENDLYSIRIAADPTVAAVMEEQRGQIAVWLRDQGYPVQQIEISERGSKQYPQHTHSDRAPQDGDPSQDGSVRHPDDPERRLDSSNQATSDRPAFFGRRVWTA